MKQKSWWYKQEGYNPSYQNDYLIALLEHSFMWSFVVMLPFLFVKNTALYSWVLLGNTIIHSIVDNCKANEHSINLWQDQLIHFFQIWITWLIFN